MRRLSTSYAVKTIVFRFILFAGQHMINRTMKMILLFSTYDDGRFSRDIENHDSHTVQQSLLSNEDDR